MKSQARLGLRRPGKHRPRAVAWVASREMWNNLARAFEMNCHPKHYDTGIQKPCYTMNYVTGKTTWHGHSGPVYRPHAFEDLAIGGLVTLTGRN